MFHVAGFLPQSNSNEIYIKDTAETSQNTAHTHTHTHTHKHSHSQRPRGSQKLAKDGFHLFLAVKSKPTPENFTVVK